MINKPEKSTSEFTNDTIKSVQRDIQVTFVHFYAKAFYIFTEHHFDVHVTSVSLRIGGMKNEI